MDVLMIILRILHIFSGIFWVGTNFFMVLFLVPSLRLAGPAGGTVMGKLTTSRFSLTIGLAAIITVLAGLTMYWLDSKGFQLSWITGPSGIVLTDRSGGGHSSCRSGSRDAKTDFGSHGSHPKRDRCVRRNTYTRTNQRAAIPANTIGPGDAHRSDPDGYRGTRHDVGARIWNIRLTPTGT